MPDFRLKKLSIRNWNKIASTEIEFPDQGLVLVTGANMTVPGKFASIGSGKSSLGEILARILCGVPGRHAEFGDYCDDKKPRKNLYVKIEADLQGSPIEIESGFKCSELSKTGEGLRYSWQKQTIERSHVDLTRQELFQTLRINPLLAQWSVFIDGDKLKFNRLSHEDAVSLAMSALAQPPWAAYRERSGAALNAARGIVLEEQTRQTNAQSLLERMNSSLTYAEQDLASAKLAYEMETRSHKQKQGELKGLETEAIAEQTKWTKTSAELKTSIDNLQKQNTAKFKVLESKRLTLKDSLRVLRESLQTKNNVRSGINSDITTKTASIEKEKKRLKAGICPTCERPLDKALLENGIYSLQSELSKLQQLLAESSSLCARAETAVEKEEQDAEHLEDQINDLRSPKELTGLSEDYENAQDELAKIERGLSQIRVDLAYIEKGPDKSYLSKCEAAVALYTTEVQNAQKALENAAHGLQLAQETVRAIEYWHRAFGPAGIPNLVLESAVSPLNAAARRISWAMSAGALQVSFQTSKKLVSGETRPALTITVKNHSGASKMEGNSKGEGGLDNLIIAETLSEVGGISNRMGWRFYDEVLANQEPVVKRNFLGYLQETAKRLGILIFIVDHGTEAAGYADHVLEVRKTTENTEFTWR